MRRVDAPTLKSWIGDGEELAILDAREEGEFGRAHLFWAVPCPLSRAELRAPSLLPRRGVRVCVTDGGEGHAERLAALLEGELGCTNVAVLAGGVPAWAAAGFVLFSGVNVPSKAFGEWVEHHYGTPSIDAAELHAMQARGDDLVVLDSRPLDEFQAMSIPGGIDVPGGELAYRIDALAPDPGTTVVVNCAGRTRSILGAESLRRAGIRNPVLALRNGTMGWELAGFRCARGETASYPPGDPPDAAAALDRARRFADRHGVRSIDWAGLERLRAEADRTLYVLDVRSAAEFAAGHVPGALHGPGGQLVQATDRWVAVRHARIVLADNDTARSRMTGAWLRQLGGWEVLVLQEGLAGPLDVAAPMAESADSVQPVVAADLLAHGAAVVDVRPSLAFRAAHLQGSRWGIRTRLGGLAAALPGEGGTVLVAAVEPAMARLAAAELAGTTAATVSPLAGGPREWRAAGLPVVADRHDPPDVACLDIYLRPYDRNEGVEEAMREYLSWEIDLVRAVARDGDAPFGAW